MIRADSILCTFDARPLLPVSWSGLLRLRCICNTHASAQFTISSNSSSRLRVTCIVGLHPHQHCTVVPKLPNSRHLFISLSLSLSLHSSELRRCFVITRESSSSRARRSVFVIIEQRNGIAAPCSRTTVGHAFVSP